MKGYKVNTELYIFPQEVDTFEVGEDVTKIYIQHEQLNAFKEANETIADLMVGYNYNTMTCLPKAWADHLDDDYSPEEPKTDPDLAWSANSATVTIGADDNVFPTLTNTDNVEVTYASSATGVATINNEGAITLVEAGDTDISAAFAGDDSYNAKTVTYALTVQAAEPVPTFGTLNISQDQDYELSASVQTDTDWTGKTVYVQDSENMNFYLKMAPDATDPTLLVLDEYDGNSADATYLDEHSTGTCTIINVAEDITYTCNYSWTNEVVVP